MKTLLIIGHTGFIGRHFLDFIGKKGLHRSLRVVGCSRQETDTTDPVLSAAFKCDLLVPDHIREIVDREQPAYILNATGIYGSAGFEMQLQQNVITTANLLNACSKSAALEKIVLIGSAAEYGVPKENPVRESHPEMPVNNYGLTKLYQTELAKLYARSESLPVVVARTFNLTGEGVSEKLSVGNFVRQIEAAEEGDVLDVGNLQTSRDFLPVEKAAEAYWMLLKKGVPGEVYNVCSGEATRMEELLNSLIRQSGKKLTFKTKHSLLKENDVEVIVGSAEKLKSLNAL